MSPRRRAWLRALAGAALPWRGRDARAQAPGLEPARAGALRFPADHGAHPATQTEWWYATGWLGSEAAPSHGWQITFFRSRTGLADASRAALAPRQLLIAHAALSDLTAPPSAPRRQHYDQRIVRWNDAAAPSAAAASTPRREARSDKLSDTLSDTQHDTRERAGASQTDADVWIGRWRLRRTPVGWHAHWQAERFAATLELGSTQPLLLHGREGFSQKAADARHASHYVSDVQLAVRGELQLDGQRVRATGRGWLDHEWTDTLLPAAAVGWDWIGINRFDGSVLMAFRLRDAGGRTLWAAGTARVPGAPARMFGPEELRWTPLRHWTSPHTGGRYPVDWALDTPLGRFEIHALMDAQELDGRRSTGLVYWEGLSALVDAQGQRVGLGYLELTGYAGRLAL